MAALKAELEKLLSRGLSKDQMSTAAKTHLLLQKKELWHAYMCVHIGAHMGAPMPSCEQLARGRWSELCPAAWLGVQVTFGVNLVESPTDADCLSSDLLVWVMAGLDARQKRVGSLVQGDIVCVVRRPSHTSSHTLLLPLPIPPATLPPMATQASLPTPLRPAHQSNAYPRRVPRACPSQASSKIIGCGDLNDLVVTQLAGGARGVSCHESEARQVHQVVGRHVPGALLRITGITGGRVGDARGANRARRVGGAGGLGGLGGAGSGAGGARREGSARTELALAHVVDRLGVVHSGGEHLEAAAKERQGT